MIPVNKLNAKKYFYTSIVTFVKLFAKECSQILGPAAILRGIDICLINTNLVKIIFSENR